jgi:hypothetical protein
VAGVERVVILGTAHQHTDEPFALTRKDFATPLGTVKTDTSAVDALLSGAGRNLLADEFAHRAEHSVELELVFVQHLAQKAGRDFAAVPVLCGSFHAAMEAGASPMELPGVAGFVDALRALAVEGGGRALVVAGADLSHVGPRFGTEHPLDATLLTELERADRRTLGFVEKNDADGFFADIAQDENARNVCGVAPIYVTLKALEGADVKLLRYEQWCEEDGASCVSFASCALS